MRYRRAFPAWFLAFSSLLAAPLRGEDAGDGAPELQPYTVTISVAFSRDARFTAAFRREFLESLRMAAAGTAGATWDLTVEPNDQLVRVDRDGLARLAPDDAAQWWGGADKAFLLLLECAGPRRVVSVREWDAVSRQLGPPITAELDDERDLLDESLRLIGRAFRPTLTIVDVDPSGERAQLLLRAGALAEADAGEQPIRGQLGPGSIVQPVFRYYDRDRNLRDVQPLPWTWLIVETVERGRVACRIVSGLRTPLGRGGRRSVELMAVAARPRYPVTRLHLVTQDDGEPLAGREVVVSAARDAEAAESEPRPLLSGRGGELTIPANEAVPLVWIEVGGGRRPTARVPYVVGFDAEATLALPDDTARLTAEAAAAQLKGRLVDAVARRATVVARVRKLAKEGDWEAVDQRMAELSALPAAREFHEDLALIRARVDESIPADDPLFTDLTDLINRFLADDGLRAVREEVQELRRVAAAGGDPADVREEPPPQVGSQ